jgi:GntR family transcriptional regulator/MocR family aminotransferase
MRAFRAGVPDVSQFPHEDWSRCLSGRSRSLRVHDLSYASLAGIPELRQAIVDHVSELRGVVAHSEQVIIVPSTQAAIDICARVLMDAGEVAWIEDPGYLGARAALNASGARLVAVPCDEEGLVVPNPHLPAPRLIYATPSHQYPTGATMSLQRRVALLNLAEQLDAFILEDDYDSDFRYRERPIAALQGIDGGRRVIYLGTFSKVLAPGLHVAFLIAPPAVAKLIGDAIATTGQIVSVHIQAALADFIRGGYLRTHIRKMRTCYASRLDCAIGALAHHCGSMASIKKPPGGLQLCAELPDGYDDVAICAELARVGVAAMPLSRFFLGPARPGLLLGFALPQENEIQTAARSIACVLRTYSAERRAG